MDTNNYIPTFPESYEEASYVYGALIKEGKEEDIISFRKLSEGLRPIGATLRIENDTYFDKDKYLYEFSILVQSLRRINGESFYTEQQQEEIVRYESMKDSQRGNTAPYFRTLIYNWLKKTGLYATQLFYVGHIPREDKILTKHLFHVRECMTFHNTEQVFITSFSHERFIFDRNLAKEDEIKMFKLSFVVNNMYKGQNNAYHILLLKLLMDYYGNIALRDSYQEKYAHMEALVKKYTSPAY